MCDKCRESVLQQKSRVVEIIRGNLATLIEFWGGREEVQTASKHLRRLVAVFDGAGELDDHLLNRVQVALRNTVGPMTQVLNGTPIGQVETTAGAALGNLMRLLTELGWAFEVKEMPPPQHQLVGALIGILRSAAAKRGEDEILEAAANAASGQKDEGLPPIGFASPVKVKVDGAKQ